MVLTGWIWFTFKTFKFKTLGLCPKPRKLLKKFDQNFDFHFGFDFDFELNV